VNPLHIVQVSAYYPPHLGGQENAVASLANQLAQTGHALDVLTSTHGGGKRGMTVQNDVCIHRSRGITFGHAPIMPWLPVVLFRTASRDSLVHVHIGQAFAPEIVWLVSKLRGFKYIAQLHIDFQPSGPAGVLLPLYKRFILRRVIQSATAVVTLNKKTQRIVRDEYDYSGPIGLLSNGIDDAYFEINRAQPHPKPPKILRLLFVGRLSPQKNIIALLKALRLVQIPVQLDVIGDGPERPAIERFIATHTMDNVTVHGRLPRDGIMPFYATNDALVMPSLYEAQPLVLLEAMAARIPIIGTDVVGVAEHIRNIGIITKPHAPGIAQGIEQYVTQYNDLPAMVERGYEKAKKMQWNRIVRTYEELYEDALGV
jgi:glycosyltransferase involved in cell wall biosynthesis